MKEGWLPMLDLCRGCGGGLQADTYRSDLGVDLAVKMITMGLGLPGTAASDALMADARALFAEREAHELHPELRAALFGARVRLLSNPPTTFHQLRPDLCNWHRLVCSMMWAF